MELDSRRRVSKQETNKVYVVYFASSPLVSKESADCAKPLP